MTVYIDTQPVADIPFALGLTDSFRLPKQDDIIGIRLKITKPTPTGDTWASDAGSNLLTALKVDFGGDPTYSMPGILSRMISHYNNGVALTEGIFEIMFPLHPYHWEGVIQAYLFDTIRNVTITTTTLTEAKKFCASTTLSAVGTDGSIRIYLIKRRYPRDIQDKSREINQGLKGDARGKVRYFHIPKYLGGKTGRCLADALNIASITKGQILRIYGFSISGNTSTKRTFDAGVSITDIEVMDTSSHWLAKINVPDLIDYNKDRRGGANVTGLFVLHFDGQDDPRVDQPDLGQAPFTQYPGVTEINVIPTVVVGGTGTEWLELVVAYWEAD